MPNTNHNREIESLRRLVKDLQTSTNERTAISLPTPSRASSSVGQKRHVDSDEPLDNGSGPQQWEGIYASGLRSDQQSYYGPSSTFYFISRIGAYLSTVLPQPFADQNFQLRGLNKPHSSSSESQKGEDTTRNVKRTRTDHISLPREQEEYFLGLFWESWHCSIPIIDEGEFRQQYNSLWDVSGQQRKQSALADIIIALSLQYGMACIPRDKSQEGFGDATLAGRRYYRRCQSLSTLELESPSIFSIQCHIYSSVYLCCASFQNMAYTTMAIAVRTAQMLGLHLEPPKGLSPSEKELRKRIWWVLYTLESKTCMKLGRPFSVQWSQMTVTLPSDEPDAASLFNSVLRPHSGVTWLTYVVECQKLIASTCKIYGALYTNFGMLLSQHGEDSPYKDRNILESCAEFFTSHTYVLQDWLTQLPDGMKTLRRGPGSPYSFDRTPLEIDASAPIWLQRQRIWLELVYHTMALNLHRPFITFCHSPGIYTPVAGRCAIMCISHAIAHTHIMHQVLSETDLLNGWQESFQWQWNATVTLMGFVFAYPIGPSTPTVREALDKSMVIFKMLECHFANASYAAAIMKEMACKADLHLSRFREGLTGTSTASISGAPETSDTQLEGGVGQLWEDMDNSGFYSEFIDWALSVDTANSFEDFYSDTSNFFEDSSYFNQL